MREKTHTIDRDDLVDISTVKIDQSLPRDERIADYIRQIKNPYCIAAAMSWCGSALPRPMQRWRTGCYHICNA